MHCEWQIRDLHAELGVERTAERADTGPMAAASIAPNGTSAVTELAAPLFHRRAVGAHDVRAHRADVQRVLDTRKQRIELGAIHAPHVEHEIRRSKARA